ncbi:MAG: phosphoadenosine phosphosulfate reductase family protein [Thermoguttaceae bacterium]|nr:phosphoadenosine phosphosulfate reductase family protein [Thermoguttaceae bacterium]
MKQVVSFSGGKDSTAMLLWLLEHKEPVDDVVFFDTGWEFPEMYDHLKKVEDYTGIKINIIKPSESFTFMLTQHRRVISRGKYKGKEMIGYGFPSFSTRWCTGRKQDAMNKYFMQYKQSGVTNCIGYAADEPKRFGNLHDTSWQKYRYPLVEAGMVEADALKYCYERGFDWGGGYTRHKRLSCWCCPLQNKRSLRTLYRHYPKLWSQLKDWQKTLANNAHGQKGRHGYIDFQNNKSVFDLEARFKAEDDQQCLFD